MNRVLMSGTILETDMKYTQSGLAINTINLGGQTSENKKFYTNVTFFGEHAERLANKQGTHILLRGRIEQDRWETPEGEKRSKLNITGNYFHEVNAVELSDADARGQQVLTNALNQVVLQGNLVRDVENRETQNGTYAVSGAIAYTARKREGNEWVDGKTSFVNFTQWSDTPIEASKGRPAMILGAYESRNYEGKRYEQVVGHLVRLVAFGGIPDESAFTQQVPKQSKPPAPSLDLGDEFPPEEDLPF